MEKSLRLEQEGILSSLLKFMALGGLIAWIPSVWASILHGFPAIALVDTLGYGLVLIAAFSRHFGFKAKLTIVVSVSILIGAVVLFYTGPLGAGYLWLVAAVVLSALFGRTLVVVVSIGASALIMVIWAVALVFGFDGKGSEPFTVAIIGSNLLVICLSLSIVIRLLLNSLEASILESREYADRLATELVETKKVKQELERSLELKNALLRELHHRVRNNMQIVQSLLSLDSPGAALELAGRRVGALAMANDLSLTGLEAPLVEIRSLFKSLVYQYTVMVIDPGSRPLVLQEDDDGGCLGSIDPQLAGLLAIISSDILLAISRCGTGGSVSLAPAGNAVRVEFRFFNSADPDQARQVLAAIAGSRLAAGAAPDIRTEPLEASLELGPGLRLSFRPAARQAG